MSERIAALTAADALWDEVARCAEACSWRAGKSLASAMREGRIAGWERVFAALDGGQVAGFCTLCAEDCLPGAPYTPYIGYVFVGESHRGHRLSQRLIDAAANYAASLGFARVYLVSDHRGLYEKYGFIAVDAYPAPWDEEETETVFARETHP